MLAPGDNLLEVENLRVSFGTERGVAKVLDGVNLTIRRGEIMGLVGESGCGKTTLARAILGILPGNAQHEAGSIRFRGEDLLKMPRRSRRRPDPRPAHHLHPARPVRLVQPAVSHRIAGAGSDEMEVAARGPRMPAAACLAFSAATRGRAARPMRRTLSR